MTTVKKLFKSSPKTAWFRKALQSGWTMSDIRNYLVSEQDYDISQAQDFVEKQAKQLPVDFYQSLGNPGLGMPYTPASESCFRLDVEVPDSMGFETHAALDVVRQKLGGDLNKFVEQRLNFSSNKALCEALAAEQIDGVALAIFNIEQRNQGMIIGDQTGIGKGRQAAAIIRYAVETGKTPIFLSEKPNLFSDMYRDLVDIGYEDIKPFILNGREAKTHVKDEDGTIVHKAPESKQQKQIIDSRVLPSEYDYIMSTYTQIASSRPTAKQAFLSTMARDNIIILDESHNASGNSATGEYLQAVLRSAKGVIFLSATFAKRSDNMPIYAQKTAMSDATLDNDALIAAIENGGVALQEVLSAQLVSEGQMLRRQRGYEGIEVNYITLNDKKELHDSIADRMTAIMRDIAKFQENHVAGVVKKMDKEMNAEMSDVEVTQGTAKAGMHNSPYFSKLFNVINQMLFSVKALDVAEHAVKRLNEDKKVIVAFSSTMGAFIDNFDVEDEIPADFITVLQKGLDSVLSVTKTDFFGKKSKLLIDPKTLGDEAQSDYNKIKKKIEQVSSGVKVSPIDVVIEHIEKHGYKVAEVTGRKKYLKYSADGSAAVVLNRQKESTNDAFRQFNDNEVDVLLINQSGSTGASAHAKPTVKVPEHLLKQRVMIVLQAELDVNTEVQKRGRINRTGQKLKPIYDYLITPIPAEKRLMMMLQRKLKSLDANTSSNQKGSEDLLKSDDFLNKYGDKIVAQWVLSNPELNDLMGDPLKLRFDSGDMPDEVSAEQSVDASKKVTGRVAILPTKDQAKFYEEVLQSYHDYVDFLIQEGKYDLEVETLNLEAETMESTTVVVGQSGKSVFGNDTIREKVEVNNLSKPYTRQEVEEIIKANLEEKTKDDYKDVLKAQLNDYAINKMQTIQAEIDRKFDKQIENWSSDKLFEKLQKDHPEMKHEQVMQMFSSQVNSSRTAKIENEINKVKSLTNFIDGMFDFFYPGRAVNYRKASFDDGMTEVKGVFLGWDIDYKANNPYAPSNVKGKFAFASTDRYLRLPLSGETRVIVESIQSASFALRNSDQDILNDWESIAKESSTDRIQRFMLTGNLLQGMGQAKGGKLVSYTTKDGKEKKGVLMPNTYNPIRDNTSDHVAVPIFKAWKVINGLAAGTNISVMNADVNFFRMNEGEPVKVAVAASKKRGGKFYQDENLLKNVVGNNFEQMSDRFVAVIPNDKLKDFCEVLQVKHGLALKISKPVFEIMKEDFEKTESKVIDITDATVKDNPITPEVEVKPATNNSEDKERRKRIIKVKAKARLRLLKLKKAS